MNIADLIRLIFILVGSLFIGTSSEVSPIPPPADMPPGGHTTANMPLVIEAVDVLVLESYPMQLTLQVSGYQQDGCQAPVQVAQSRDGNTVIVQVYRTMLPGAMCPQVIQSYEASIKLEGGFESGDYSIRVNDFIVDITL